MIKPINISTEAKLFKNLVNNGKELAQKAKSIKRIPFTQKNILMRSVAQDINPKNPEVVEAFSQMFKKISEGKLEEGIEIVKPFLPNKAAIKETSLGTAVMAEGWSKPIVFPKGDGFKWVGWIDKPGEVTTKELWEGAYGKLPAARMGAVGNSNIKPEQVRGGCSMTKAELSKKYEDAIQDFYRPVIGYLKDTGASSKDIGFAFAHSDCGVDKAARAIVEEHGLKGFAVTPTEYTQYLRGTEIPASKEFPDGAILADFPFPTVLTRNIGQIVDYGKTYGKMVGKNNPMAIFGGGEHAFIQDTGNALLGKEGSRWVPVDIMKDRFGIEIPAKNDKGDIINASRNILDNINSNPHEQYKYAFDNYLPNTLSKQDLVHDGQKSIATIAYTELAKAGKIGK